MSDFIELVHEIEEDIKKAKTILNDFFEPIFSRYKTVEKVKTSYSLGRYKLSPVNFEIHEGNSRIKIWVPEYHSLNYSVSREEVLDESFKNSNETKEFLAKIHEKFHCDQEFNEKKLLAEEKVKEFLMPLLDNYTQIDGSPLHILIKGRSWVDWPGSICNYLKKEGGGAVTVSIGYDKNTDPKIPSRTHKTVGLLYAFNIVLDDSFKSPEFKPTRELILDVEKHCLKKEYNNVNDN